MTTPRTRRGPYAKGTAQREAIIRTALDHFAQHGYRGVSMREIARQAGLSQAGLLHHFPSKDELLLATLAARDTLSDATAQARARDPLEQIVAVVEDNTTRPQLVRMFAILSGEATDGSHPGHDYFRGRQAFVLGWFAERFRAAVAGGLAREDLDCLAAARLCQATMYGLQAQWLLEPSTDMVGLFRTAIRTIALAGPVLPAPDAPGAPDDPAAPAPG